ncbi:MAG: flagellin [Methanoregula sp.]|jgi:flagellar protein FlaG|uniref:flagellin n=1 Tax=Methanoregula sp. TaxID=2052170 RepID=UPI003D09A94D
MSGETIASAILLITAVICAAVLIVAIYPAVFTMVGTFGSASHTADQNIRTDFSIILATYNSDNSVTVYLKNIGSAKLPLASINSQADVFCGPANGFTRLTNPPHGEWTLNPAGSDTVYWIPGETLEVDITPHSCVYDPTQPIYFEFVLPNSGSRSVTFSPVETVTPTPIPT